VSKIVGVVFAVLLLAALVGALGAWLVMLIAGAVLHSIDPKWWTPGFFQTWGVLFIFNMLIGGARAAKS
jgi:hypothetical protein